MSTEFVIIFTIMLELAQKQKRVVDMVIGPSKIPQRPAPPSKCMTPLLAGRGPIERPIILVTLMHLPPHVRLPKRKPRDRLPSEFHRSPNPLWLHGPYYLVPANGTNGSQGGLTLLLYPLNPLNQDPALLHPSSLLPPTNLLQILVVHLLFP